jgi:3-dehydroquinate synthase
MTFRRHGKREHDDARAWDVWKAANEALLARCGLPTSLPPETDPQRLLDLMRLDKKNVSGRLRLILWRGIGQAEIAPDVDAAAILSVLEEGLRAEG